MKRITKTLILLTVVLLGATASRAQMIVKKIPPVPQERRPRRPSAAYVWIPVEWDQFEHSYMRGFWEVPPRKGLVWIAGRWVKIPKGYQWAGGHWK
jgi:hypothetical protein